MAGLTNGEQVNFAKIRDWPRTVREHYRILEDTLVGDSFPRFAAPGPASQSTAKFYFFDVGVANTLRRTGVIEPGSDAYGRALEHLVFLEVRSWHYRGRDDPLTYWRSRSQFEVDLVRRCGRHRGQGEVTGFGSGLQGLALAEEIPLARKLVATSLAPAGRPGGRDRPGTALPARVVGWRHPQLIRRRAFPGNSSSRDLVEV